ncbi:MAG: DUF1330 domain-containing protein [Candidatus Hodarchaeota archaeon]
MKKKENITKSTDNRKMMNYYFIAQININDKKEYQKYIEVAGDVFKKYNGKYLAVDNNPEILEGEWNYNRSVLINFKSKNDFVDWYYSKEYQEILKYRLAAADCDTILVKGLEN